MFANLPLRKMSLGLAWGTIAFGIATVVAPRPFGKIFGLPLNQGPAADLVIRSIGARDAINGIGILSATLHNGRVAPWILARTVADATDTIGVGLAMLQGERNPRFVLLGGIAGAATIVDLVLYFGYKAAGRTVSAQAQ